LIRNHLKTYPFKNQMQKILNKRISEAFFNALMEHPLFRENYEAISGAEYFLLTVARFNDSNNRDSEISSLKIKDLFKNYDSSGNYLKYVHALIELGLLVNTNASYRVTSDGRPGWCKRYFVTQRGLDLITNNCREYLKKLYFDPAIRRLNQQSISRRQVFKQEYYDDILDYIWDGLVNISFDWEGTDAIVKTLKVKSRPSNLRLLQNFKEKRFGHLKYNESDGRVWNEYVALNSELRNISKYRNMIRFGALDIRACHPTFWGLYVKEIFDKYSVKDIDSNSLNIKESTIINYINRIDYYQHQNRENINTHQEVSNNTTYCWPETLHYTVEELNAEVIRYNQMFTNSEDVRAIIGEVLGRTTDQCKQYLNRTINGSRTHKPLLRYLQEQFPILFDVWIRTDMKSTGPNISKMFETKLMLNPELFKLADSLGVKLMYEYDGFSIFVHEQDRNAKQKVSIIEDFIKQESLKRWNLNVVLKAEDAEGNPLLSAREINGGTDEFSLAV
jgi:hypothetical protein